MEAWITYEKGKFYLCKNIILAKKGWEGEGVMAVLSEEDLPEGYTPQEEPVAVEFHLQPRGRKELIKYDPSHVDYNPYEPNPKPYKYTAKSLADIIPFGKYKGKSLKEVLDKGQWRYIHWLNSENIVYYPRSLENDIHAASYVIANYHWPDPDYFDYEYNVDASYS